MFGTFHFPFSAFPSPQSDERVGSRARSAEASDASTALTVVADDVRQVLSVVSGANSAALELPAVSVHDVLLQSLLVPIRPID